MENACVHTAHTLHAGYGLLRLLTRTDNFRNMTHYINMQKFSTFRIYIIYILTLLFSSYIAICKPETNNDFIIFFDKQSALGRLTNQCVRTPIGWDFSFVNCEFTLWIISIISLFVFSIPILPFKCIKSFILNKIGNEITNKSAEQIYKVYHSEIKQTFTFSFAMFISPILLGKGETMNSSTLLVTYSTTAIYTCIFAFASFYKSNDQEIKLINFIKLELRNKVIIFIFLMTLFCVNSYLLILGWKKQGDFHWVLSWCLVFPTLLIQLCKSVVECKLNNTEGTSMQKSAPKSYTQSNKQYSKHPNSRKTKKKKK